MHPRVEELTDFLARTRDDLLATATSIRAEDRERRATDDGWTAAEVLDHLRIVESGTAALLARRIQRARENGVGVDADTSSVRDRLDHAGVTDDPSLHEAPDIVRPTHGARFDDALAGLRDSRAAMLDVARQLETVDATRVMARHALLGELDGYQWLLFIGQHERRHLRQLQRIASALAPH